MALTDLASGKYLLVTTYKKDASSVPTPVWVVPDGDALSIWTAAGSWKVKRIRNRADVIVGPCDPTRRAGSSRQHLATDWHGVANVVPVLIEPRRCHST